MKLSKPTVKSCIDGKDHIWMIVNEDTDIVKGTRLERRWCRKCGCLTQVTINKKGEAVVLLSNNKTPHLVMPQLVRAAAK